MYIRSFAIDATYYRLPWIILSRQQQPRSRFLHAQPAKPDPLDNDCSRETLLNYTTPAFNLWKDASMLTAQPEYRVRWMKKWHDFPSDVIGYWEQVAERDKDALVTNEKWSTLWYNYFTDCKNVVSQHGIRGSLRYSNFLWHQNAPNYNSDVPVPSNKHSAIREFYDQWILVADCEDSDYDMITSEINTVKELFSAIKKGGRW